MNGYPNLPTATAVALQKFTAAPAHAGTALPASFHELHDGRCQIFIAGQACLYTNATLMRQAWDAMVKRGAIYPEASPC